MINLTAAICGILFGFGLIVSGMAQPAKVLNFLDLLTHLRDVGREAAGAWIEAHFDDLNHRSTVDIRDRYL